jgi:hypothetical protein
MAGGDFPKTTQLLFFTGEHWPGPVFLQVNLAAIKEKSQNLRRSFFCSVLAESTALYQPFWSWSILQKGKKGYHQIMDGY